MARRAHGGRKPRSNVVWHTSAKRCRALPSRLVAAKAIRVRGGEGIVVANMAIRAGHDSARRRQLMRTGQRPSGRGVIEDRCGPRNSVVATGAIGRCEGRSGTWVHRIVGLLPRRQVALRISAVRRSDLQIVVIVDVAGSAAWHLAAIGD